METFLQAVVSGLLTGGFYALMGMGQNVIFGVMNIVNFCHGELLMIGMYLSYCFFTYFGIDPYLSIPLVAICMFALGACTQHVLITPSLSTKSFTNLLFLTMGLGMLFQNLAQMLFSADFLSVVTSYSNTVMRLGPINISLPKVVSLIALIIVTIFLFWFLQKTRIGKEVRATSQNALGAQVVGININLIYVITYGIGACIAGIAGGLLLPFYYVYPQVGTTYGLRALIVVVLGGLGNIKGAFLAGIALGMVETVSSLIVGPAYKDLTVFLLFIVYLIVRQNILLKGGSK